MTRACITQAYPRGGADNAVRSFVRWLLWLRLCSKTKILPTQRGAGKGEIAGEAAKPAGRGAAVGAELFWAQFLALTHSFTIAFLFCPIKSRKQPQFPSAFLLEVRIRSTMNVRSSDLTPSGYGARSLI